MPEHPSTFPGQAGAALARWVDSKQFSATRLRPGYDEEQVDHFLDRIRDTFLGVADPPLAARDIESAQFGTTRLRPGYDEAEVDTFLDEVRSALAGLPVAAQEITSVQFTVERPGYDEAEVDAFLDRSATPSPVRPTRRWHRPRSGTRSSPSPGPSPATRAMRSTRSWTRSGTPCAACGPPC